MRLDVIVTLTLEGAADVLHAGAGSGAGENEGAFKCRGCMHGSHMGAYLLKSQSSLPMLHCNKGRLGPFERRNAAPHPPRGAETSCPSSSPDFACTPVSRG